MNKHLLLSFSLLSLFGLAGCAKYKAKPLERLGTNKVQRADQFVAFGYHAFDKEDCENYLDRNVLGKGYQPVQIEITNYSDRRLKINADSFPFTLVAPERVARSVHIDVVAKANQACDAAARKRDDSPLTDLFATIMQHDVSSSAKANDILDEDFTKKSINISRHYLQPHGSVNGLIFVPQEEFFDNFTFTIFDAETNERFVIRTNTGKLNA